MNLEMAQHIIEQEALLILIANPELTFDVTNGNLLSKFFRNNESKVVTEHDEFNNNATHSYVFKIDHPKHGIGYYKVSGYWSTWEDTFWDGQYTVRPSKRDSSDWTVIDGRHLLPS